MHIFNIQTEFSPAFNLVKNTHGSVDYRNQRELFMKIDHILIQLDLENYFIELAAQAVADDYNNWRDSQKIKFQNHCRLTLRGNIARIILRKSHREFCTRLADSNLLQWFLLIDKIDGIKAYAKSTSDRFAKFVSEDVIKAVMNKLMQQLSSKDNNLTETLQLKENICFDDVYIDSFCLKTNIHYPVDWVLLRDATRTLMKAVSIIRGRGLVNRMQQEPLDFLSGMNSLCMQMTNVRRKKNAAKMRKKTNRIMKQFMKKIKVHAEKHRDILLEEGLTQTDLTQPQIDQIISRINNVLDKLPEAIQQAHERIIGGRRVSPKDKILSLYEDDVDVIVRGKSSSEVEFGNKVCIAELGNGLIIDCDILKEQASDTKLIKPMLERIKTSELKIKSIWSDRGFSSAENTKLLEENGVIDGLCPKSPIELREKIANHKGFKEGLKRRAGTEARVSIIGKLFIGNPCKSKGFENRKLAFTWSILAHNLWVLARLETRLDEAAEAA